MFYIAPGDHYLFSPLSPMVSATEDPGHTAIRTLRRLQSTGSDSSFNLLYLIPIVLGALLLFALLWLLLRICGHRKTQRNNREERDTPPPLVPDQAVADGPSVSPVASFSSFKDETPNKNVWLSGSGRTLNSGRSFSSSKSLVLPDFALDTTQKDQLFRVLHHDAALATQRLAVDKIAVEKVLGETATRKLWLCQFEGEEIVVKRLTPPYKDEDVFPALKIFVHEIRLTASLEHPNIVQFLGVAWGQSLRSLCFVAEFLARGDLASFLRRCRKRRQQLALQNSSSSLSSRGSSSSVQTGPLSLQSSGSGFTLTSWVDDKLPIAIGVIRAVVYLHTRRPKPIVYRVLRATKVALSDRFEPKLIDLTPAAGGAPPVDQEELAAGVGNAFWTAPELLTGEEPTPASDVFAFGVLLAEIDSDAKRPYHTAKDARGDKLRAFQVLNLVASGELRPQFANNCPREVRQVALACMRQNPLQRPTAREVLQGLQSCAACCAA